MKKKLLRSGIALLAVLLVIGITSCGDSDSSTNTVDPNKSNNTQLISIRVGGIGSPVKFKEDDAKAAWSDITNFAKCVFASEQSKNATVTLTADGSFKGTIEIAKVSKGATTAAFKPFVPKTSFEFADEDRIYIKMIAENGKTMYYGAEIEIGSDTALKDIILDGLGFNRSENFGTPVAAANITPNPLGAITLSSPQPTNGVAVIVNPNDPDAEVAFGKVNDPENQWFKPSPNDNSKLIKFTGAERLAVRVKSKNGRTTQYYRIVITFPDTLAIPNGTPELGDDAVAIDPKWNDVEAILITKQNPDDAVGSFFTDPTSTGEAKFLWDNTGLWVFVQVSTEYNENASVDVFLNEDSADNTVTEDDYTWPKGGVYSITKILASQNSPGEISARPAAAETAFKALNKSLCGFSTGISGPSYYNVIFQIPWRNGVPSDSKVSLEVQINVVDETGSRIGILKLFNTTGDANKNSLAPATLAD
jgi:hypothetical protein